MARELPGSVIELPPVGAERFGNRAVVLFGAFAVALVRGKEHATPERGVAFPVPKD